MSTPYTFVLVPGAGGAGWYWHRVAERLRGRGHVVVAVDLPTDDAAAGLAEYADAVVQAVSDADRTASEVVLVAQSMGAYAASIACGRLQAARIVLVNAMVPAPGESPGEWWANTGQAQAMQANDERAGRAPGTTAEDEFDAFTYFLHDLPQDVIDASMAHQREQSETPFGQRWPLDAWPDVPTTVLVGRDDRFFPADFQRQVAQQRLGLAVEELPGGHLVALSRPDELAERLAAPQSVVAAPSRP